MDTSECVENETQIFLIHAQLQMNVASKRLLCLIELIFFFLSNLCKFPNTRSRMEGAYGSVVTGLLVALHSYTLTYIMCFYIFVDVKSTKNHQIWWIETYCGFKLPRYIGRMTFSPSSVWALQVYSKIFQQHFAIYKYSSWRLLYSSNIPIVKTRTTKGVLHFVFFLLTPAWYRLHPSSSS